MMREKKDASLVKGTGHRLGISLGTVMMFLGIAVLTFAGYVLYQIAWHSPSAYQSYESGQICAVLKQHVCSEIGMGKFEPGYPCGNRDTRWSASDESTGIEVYGITTQDAKERFMALALIELKKLRDVRALSVRFYDDINNKQFIEDKLIRR